MGPKKWIIGVINSSFCAVLQSIGPFEGLLCGQCCSVPYTPQE
jgi:hypothetical protein